MNGVNVFGKCMECESEVKITKNNFYKRALICDNCLDELLYEDLVSRNYNNPTFKIYNHQNNNKLLLGLELETEIKDGEKVGIKTKKFKDFLTKEKIVDFFHIKDDGSLDCGIEVITHPFSLPYIKKYGILKKALNSLKKNNFDSENKSRNAGIHIHLNREFFSNENLVNMALFFALNKKYLFKISGRDSINNEYCEYKELDLEYPESYLHNNNKYSALNFATNGKKTVEIRIFDSTLERNIVMAYIEFANCISEYVKETSREQILGNDIYGNSDISWNLFKKFVRKNGYRNLYRLIKERE